MRSIILAVVLAAQTQPAFEVASVKPAGENVGVMSADSQQVRYTGVRLRSLLQDAYRVKTYQVNRPAWLVTERYDVVAKLPEGASKDQVPAMLRALLIERFRMAVHTEVRQDRVYALSIAKNGPHLTKSNGRPAGFSTHSGSLEFVSVTLDAFASVLSGYLDYPVLDMTGTQGQFDITVAIEGGPPNTLPDTNFSSSVLAAMKDLGLKLETRDAPILHVVVDSAEKVPTGN